MRVVAYVLIAVLVLLIGGKVYFTALRKRVCFRRIRSESLPEGFLGSVCPQLAETGVPVQERKTLETTPRAEDRFRELAENGDPYAPDQAVLYIEDSNIILVSTGVAVRIARGDRRLCRKIARWTEDFENAYVVIADFGFCECRN